MSLPGQLGCRFQNAACTKFGWVAMHSCTADHQIIGWCRQQHVFYLLVFDRKKQVSKANLTPMLNTGIQDSAQTQIFLQNRARSKRVL